MPARDGSSKQPGSGRSPWKKTDKCVHAEIKNRLETMKFNVHMKHLDKAKLQQEFSVNRAKRMVVKGMELMKKQSTGICVAGRPPDGPHDNAYHKSQYFHGGSTISEKRLQNWRIKERQMEKTSKAFNEELGVLPWERKTSESVKFGQSFQIVMGLMGYDPQKMEDILTKTEQQLQQHPHVPKASARPHQKRSEDTDVFECLRRTPDGPAEPRLVRGEQPLKSRSLSSFGDRDFSVTAWESDLVKEYTDSMAHPRDIPEMRIHSAPNGRAAKHSNRIAWSADGRVAAKNAARARVRPQSAFQPATHSFRLSLKRSDDMTTSDKQCNTDNLHWYSSTDHPQTKEESDKVNSTNNEHKTESVHSFSDTNKPSVSFHVHAGTSISERRESTATNPDSKRTVPVASIHNKSKHSAIPVHLQIRKASSSTSNDSPDGVEKPRLPRWKRDLMKEAPPSLAGAKGPEKVNLVMSRSQRRRELEQLVDENVSDVKKIYDQEHSRRLESRANVFRTMVKVQQAMDNLALLPEDEEDAGGSCDGETDRVGELVRRQSVVPGLL